MRPLAIDIRFDHPGAEDENLEWTDSATAPIPAANLPGIAESLETSWGKRGRPGDRRGEVTQ